MLIKLLLIFPAIIVFIVLAIGMVFALISPVMIIPWLVLSSLVGGMYYYLSQLCNVIDEDKARPLQLSYIAVVTVAVLAGVVAVTFMINYLVSIDKVLFYPDIVFLMAALSHTCATLSLAWCYVRLLKRC